MSWNYRVIRKRHIETGTVTYHIHEVYYGEDQEIERWTRDPVEPLGETATELREDTRFFLQAYRFPILEEKATADGPTLVPDDSENAINDGHYFELMDRASVAVDYVSQFVGSHPVVRKERNLREIYERAEEALAELYQHAGGLAFDRSSE
ncbi:MAG: hypothetical protein OXH06_12760 [Gemmatimonadetes bacterium]|nr:hypothetical protein [Gemmatimonadota bacterium]MDE3259024.1 hypothetical protein [Gemmatimonadota bacterium]